MDKQIEEMAEIMYGVEAFELEPLAEALYTAGYRKIPELPQDTVLTVDDIAELLTIVARDTRKETAEKFAERLKSMAYKSTDWSHGQHPMVVEVDYIDEICKELIGGK